MAEVAAREVVSATGTTWETVIVEHNALLLYDVSPVTIYTIPVP